jgi:glycerol-3-phosphate dehydrogenase
MKTFSHQDRRKNILQMSQQKFDLFVIGGGINGAGVARDAALRGMSVCLIEASDFASGTSSRSSKLIHGGIRYLENLEFKLVFEALTERQRLFEIAPHLVHPLRFMLPLYKGGRVGMFMMGLGMWLYDALSLFQAPEMHERLSSHETLARMPTLKGQDLLGSYVYSDAYMDDDRLVHETLRSANEAGACCANFVKAIGAEFSVDGKIRKVLCEDQITHQKFSVEAQHVVSSVGPWTDQLGETLFKKWKKILRPTKGVHLTFQKERLPMSSAVVMAAEKRIVFGIPRHEMVIVGTTDTDFQGPPETVSTTPEDVQYLLGVLTSYFPGAEIKVADIVASYAGVRPLVHDGSENESKTSREHVIFTEEHNVTFVAGGKYTTYRLMAQQVVEECLRYFKIEDRVRFNRCLTTQPLNALVTVDSRMEDFRVVDKLVEKSNLTLQEAQILVERHGAEAWKIWKKFGPASYWELEAAQAVENTMCLHLVDFYSRRVPLLLAEVDHGISKLPLISPVFARTLGWNREQIQSEEKLLADSIRTEFAWRHKIV